ncbi:DUF2381 family protein [Archangium primigenium]|uniref:DUF2381 family protein n=1 Tax=[Archangium] primigenium TaxID=2792470 RepID=UPI00195B6D24|nr:DUF2381 family protein [Archangium primigenium]MBM7118559.1 DUF2381 family protein [Archangium primigenium]
MRPLRYTLPAVLLATAALAGETRDRPSVRSVRLVAPPNDTTHRVHVRGRIVTTLRFERPVDAGKTKLLGGEGRLEPLAVVRDKVVLEPLHDLDAQEAIPLVVTLVDGTEVSFLLRPPDPREGAPTDQQVDVFQDHESTTALHAALMDALRHNRSLLEESERCRAEEASEDHALAALLASGALAQTPFKVVDRIYGEDESTKITARVFQGKNKAAVVFDIKNLATDQSWSMRSARLTTLAEGHERAFAFRATAREISSGQSGVIALVVDGSAFVEQGALTSLWLEIYRDDGTRQAVVQLDPSLLAR